jgi:peptidylprolyl isomerase
MNAKSGDTVKVHYTLKDIKGNEVESSLKSDPIEFTIGEGKTIPGFDKGVTGMAVNEKKTITIPPEDAYGPHEKKLIFEYDKKNASADFDPQIGQTIQMHRPDGKTLIVTVIERTEKGYMMDANHPLAGKELIFDLELVEIVK